MTRARTPRAPGPSRNVRLYIAATIVVAAVGLGWAWGRSDPLADPTALITLCVLGLLSVLVRERDVGSNITFSFLSIIVIASVVLVGPAGSAIVGGLSMGFERGTRTKQARVFNAGMLAIQGLVGGVVYQLVGGVVDLDRLDGPGSLVLRVGLPLIVADVAQMLVNAVLLAGVVRLSTGMPPRRFIVQMVTNSGVAYIGYGIIGFLFVILWGPADVGPFSAVLILAPLFVARWAFVQYGEEQRAHQRALSALVTAVETKDPYAAGHSRRVAQLAEWMAEPLSMGAQEVEQLRFAAMLHDVGKIGIPTRILQRPRTITSADLETLTHHSALGVALVEDIDFLGGSLAGIRHHHERWDGQGYPDGLAGEQIPLISRVIAVADAFDALTTDRAERPSLVPEEAISQIERRGGQHFDPRVVEALGVVLQRQTWSVTTADEEVLERSWGYLDHDDPVAWERVWPTGGRDHRSAPVEDALPATPTADERTGPAEEYSSTGWPEGPEPEMGAVPEQVRAP